MQDVLYLQNAGEPISSMVDKLTPEQKSDRYAALLAEGFPKEWVDKRSARTATLFTDIPGRMSNLRSLGVEDPVRLVMLKPSILDYNRAVIHEKIAGIKKLG